EVLRRAGQLGGGDLAIGGALEYRCHAFGQLGVVDGGAVHRLDGHLPRGAGAFGDLLGAELENVLDLLAHTLIVGEVGAGQFHAVRLVIRASAAVDAADGASRRRAGQVGLADVHGLHAVDHLGRGDYGVYGVPGHAAMALAAGDADIEHVAGCGSGNGTP